MGICYLGTETPYSFERFKIMPPPKGYKPIYISHLGRHGSRYITSGTDAKELYEVLSDAGSKKMLTTKGYRLKSKVKRFLQLSNGKYGLLTMRGIQEEMGIGRRMYLRNPEAFGKEVEATSTYVTRAKQSMEAFLKGLGQFVSTSTFIATVNDEIDPILRFFDLNTAYLKYKKDGEWIQSVHIFEQRAEVAEPFLSQFFEKRYRINILEPLKIATTIYDIYANTFNMNVNLGLSQYFTQEQLCYFWENENLQNYLEKGPSYIGQNLPTDISFALLRRFIEEADEAIEKRDKSATLRFAHAETVIPFVSLLGLRGGSKQTNDLNEVSKIWRDCNISPMAANLQFIFYASKEEKDILVKLLYNEKEYPLPFETAHYPYYEWKEIRAFYMKVLQALPIPKDESVVLQVKNFNEV